MNEVPTVVSENKGVAAQEMGAMGDEQLVKSLMFYVDLLTLSSVDEGGDREKDFEKWRKQQDDLRLDVNRCKEEILKRLRRVAQ